MAFQIRFVTRLVGPLCVVLVPLTCAVACESEKARLNTVRVVEACRSTVLIKADCLSWPHLTQRVDAWGHPLRCFLDLAGMPRVVSLGRDGVPGGTGADGDVACSPD